MQEKKEDRPAVLNSAWREPLALRGLKGSTMPIWGLPKAEWPGEAASFAAHTEGKCCVLGTALGPRSRNALSFVGLASEGTGTHKTLCTRAAPFPVVSVSWPNDILIVGSSERRLGIWPGLSGVDTRALEKYDFDRQGVVLTVQTQKKGGDTAGDWAYSSCLTCVQQTAGGKGVVAVEALRLHCWDLETGVQKGLKSSPLRVSSGTVLCASASAVNESIVATGSATAGAKVVDLRGKKESVWKSTTAHRTAVRCVAMSPLVPHWLASASDGGDIRIWDIRSNAGHVLSFQHHQAILTGLCWSPLHAELICSSGIDGSMRLYSLRKPPSYAVSTIFNETPTVGLGFVAPTGSDTPLSACVIASTSGQVTLKGLTPTFLDGLMEHRFSAYGSEAEACERLAQLRHLPEAEARVRTAMEALLSAEVTQQAMELATVLHKHVPLPLPPNANLKAVEKAFLVDVAESARKLPPRINFTASRLLRDLELNVNLAHWAQTEQWELVVRELEPLDWHGDRAGQDLLLLLVSLQPDVYTRVVTAMARHSWTVGVAFFLATVPHLSEQMDMGTNEQKAVARSLLGEMIDDASISIRNRKLDEMLSELREQRGLCDLLCQPNAAQKVIDAVECDLGLERLLEVKCCATIRLYCSSLMQGCSYAKVIWLVDALEHNYRESRTVRHLQHLVKSLLTRYEVKRDRAKQAVSSEPQGSEFLKACLYVLSPMVEISITCRNLVYLCVRNNSVHQPPPKGVLSKMVSQLVKFAGEFRALVLRSLRQVVAPAVKQERDGALERASAELTKGMAATPFDKSTMVTLTSEQKQAVACSEDILQNFKKCLQDPN
ncbi:Protein tssc1-like protein [Diplonema papillatum]|nr:Protein tssc1-like protein [Diplonema papillatum]